MSDISNNINPNELSYNDLLTQYNILNSNFRRVIVEKEDLLAKNNELNIINIGLICEKEQLELKINNQIDEYSDEYSDERSEDEKITTSNLSLFKKNVFKNIKIELLDNILKLFNDIVILLKLLNKRVITFQNKINLKTQDEDDIIFYNSIILDSKNYFNSSYKVREAKFLNDVNKIMSLIDPADIVFNKIDKNLITKFKIYYGKLIRDYKESKINNSSIWIKNSKLKCIDYINKEINRCFIYHKDINVYFKETLERDIKFFEIS